MDKSTDGGLTFGTDVFSSEMPGGWDYDIPGISRANGLTITACDVSDSPYRGNIYVNWSDQRNGTGDTDIFFAKSTDGGNTWSSPKRVNNDFGTRHQFFTWMDIDQSNGNIYCVFYDRRNTTGNLTDVYIARSVDGGETFDNFKVNEETFDTESSVFFGDYIDIAVHNGKIYPIWTKMNAPNLSVWTALIDDSSLPVELISFYAEKNDNGITLNWKTASETNNKGFEIQRTMNNEQLIMDNWKSIAFVDGNGTTTDEHSYSWFDRDVQNGKYAYRLKQIDYNGAFEYSQEIVVDFSLPEKFELAQNYPNPFGKSSGSGNITTINYSLPYSVNVTLKLYNALGQKMKTLVNERQSAGEHEISLNLSSFSSGVYFYTLQTESFVATKKMLILQ